MGQRGPLESSILTNAFEMPHGKRRRLRPILFDNGKRRVRFRSGEFSLLGMEVVHKLEQDPRVVALRTPQTLVAGVDIHLVQELKWATEVLPTDWVEVRGNLTAARLGRAAVVMVGSGEEPLGRGQEGAVDNTEVLGVVEASWSSAAVGFHQCFQAV